MNHTIRDIHHVLIQYLIRYLQETLEASFGAQGMSNEAATGGPCCREGSKQ